MSAARARRPTVARDQHESAFASILSDLVARVPGARAAALVDHIGETVDYSGRLDPFAMRLAAAHWRIVLDELGGQRAFRAVRWLAMRAGRASYLVQQLPEGYALVVILARAGGFFGWRRAMAVCARELGEEAGWSWSGPPWFPVRVTADDRRRPSFVRSAGAEARPRPIDILGAVAGGLGRRERAWRVRFDTGVEATLVREPGGVWYSDEPLDSRRPDRTRSRESARKTPETPGIERAGATRNKKR
jgi:hypothetical protein